eukprot:TRINITY_DN64263_c1_g1_i4.p2 TRINITY_DN64263_c1_g1~~TRINITY_DN64263_c1_g1_i4.p2  ORF type:complete len:103 (-),score=4.97 TRINITY_DN64263_c1_g1_i4:344-652(-)
MSEQEDPPGPPPPHDSTATEMPVESKAVGGAPPTSDSIRYESGRAVRGTPTTSGAVRSESVRERGRITTHNTRDRFVLLAVVVNQINPTLMSTLDVSHHQVG